MNRLLKYIIAAALGSVSIYLLSTGKQNLRPLALIIMLLPQFILRKRGELTKPIRFRFPKWNPKQFFLSSTILLAFFLFFEILAQLPEEKIGQLFTKWYIALTMWMLYISGIIHSYFDEKEKSNQSTGHIPKKLKN
jgi:hypothetical protein